MASRQGILRIVGEVRSVKPQAILSEKAPQEGDAAGAKKAKSAPLRHCVAERTTFSLAERTFTFIDHEETKSRFLRARGPEWGFNEDG